VVRKRWTGGVRIKRNSRIIKRKRNKSVFRKIRPMRAGTLLFFFVISVLTGLFSSCMANVKRLRIRGK
jgi:hypothetical protein